MAKSKADRIFAEIYAMADKGTIMPIDTARLSGALAACPHPERVVPRLLAELVNHDSPLIRRIGVHACRKIGRFQFPGLREALLLKLSDPNAWVRYDAAWAVHDAAYDGKDVRDSL